MTPFTTIGDVSMDSLTSVWKIQATRSLPTLPGVMDGFAVLDVGDCWTSWADAVAASMSAPAIADTVWFAIMCVPPPIMWWAVTLRCHLDGQREPHPERCQG